MKLSDRKTKLAFQTDATVHSAGCARTVLVQCDPLIAWVRLAGAREEFPVPWDAIYALGCRLAVRAERAEKAGRR
jgi:hypothetical protein